MKEEVKTRFSERLRELRKEKGLTQTELGALIGYKKMSISDWEVRGKQPDYDVLIKLVKVLNTTADYLLGITDIEE